MRIGFKFERGRTYIFNIYLPFRNCVPIESEPINIHCRRMFYNQIYTLEFVEAGYVFGHSVFKE